MNTILSTLATGDGGGPHWNCIPPLLVTWWE